jgi:hypothetical protein
MSLDGSPSFGGPETLKRISQPGGNGMSRIREPQLAQLNLLLPVEVPRVDLPEDRERELSLALASLLLSATGLKVNDDES